jgi:hypothetical protein
MPDEKRGANRVLFGGFAPVTARLIPAAAEVLEKRRHELGKARVMGLASKFEASYSRVLDECLHWLCECEASGTFSEAWSQAFLDLYVDEQATHKPFVLSVRMSLPGCDLLENRKRDLSLKAIRSGTPRSLASHGRTLSEALCWWAYCEAQGRIPKSWSEDWQARMRLVWEASATDTPRQPTLSEATRTKIQALEATKHTKNPGGRPALGSGKRPKKASASPKGKRPPGRPRKAGS